MLALLLAAVVALSSCGGEDDDRRLLPAVEAPPDGARAGEVLATIDRPAPENAPHARTMAFTYAMTGVEGELVTATGLLVLPPAPPVAAVVWGHPTRGLADPCAPSLAGAETIPLVDRFVDRGWAVVAPDYEGLGGPGRHPYLVGRSEGRSLLDAAAAVRAHHADLAEVPFALWGFSQGGHAVAFAAEMVAEDGHELDVVGAAVAAPVSDVASFAVRAEQRPDQQGVLLSILAGYDAAYPDTAISERLTAEASSVVDAVDDLCIAELNEAAQDLDAVLAAGSVADDAVLGDLFEQNRAGQHDPGVPLLVVGGTEDDVVWPEHTRALAERWCGHGATVVLVERPGQGHAVEVEDLLLDWLDDRFAGRSSETTC